MNNKTFLSEPDKTVATNKSMTSKQLKEYLNNINSNVFQPVNTGLEDWKPYFGKCPHCGSTNIEANYGIVLASMPPQYNCRCKDCKGTFFSGQIKQESQTITPYTPDPGLPSYPNQPQRPDYGYGMRQGWICPRCGKVNSPDRDFCDCSGNGGWGSPIIWYCNSEGTSAGKPNTMPSVSISESDENKQNTASSIYSFEACNLHTNEKGA